MLNVILSDTMKLTKREVGVLEFVLGKRATAGEISAALGIKKSNLSKYLKKLSKLRLIAVVKKGRAREISPDPVLSFGFAESRAGFPSIRLSELFAGSMPFLISFLKGKGAFRISEIDLPQATAKRLLRKLRSLGIVFMGRKGKYELRKDAQPLAGFVRRVLVHIYLAEAEAELGTIKETRFSFGSARGLEAIFITEKEAAQMHYRPTAYSAFASFGISLILAGKHYYANIHPEPADVVIHTLAVSKDARSIAYACALMLKNSINPQHLLEKKQLFTLTEDFMRDLVRFMQCRGEQSPAGFPAWDEVERIANAV